MKKIILTLAALLTLFSCNHDNDIILTQVSLYAFQSSDSNNIDNQISIRPDTVYNTSDIIFNIFTTSEIVQNYIPILTNSAYAYSYYPYYKLVEKVQEVNVFTVNDYNDRYKAGDNINDILKNTEGETIEKIVDILNQPTDYYHQYFINYSLLDAPSDTTEQQFKIVLTMPNESYIVGYSPIFKAQ